MLKEKDFKKEQKYCADMLGMTPKQYEKALKTIKIVHFEEKNKNDDILKSLGLNKQYLKKRL